MIDRVADGVADGVADCMIDRVADGVADGVADCVADCMADCLADGLADGLADCGGAAAQMGPGLFTSDAAVLPLIVKVAVPAAVALALSGGASMRGCDWSDDAEHTHWVLGLVRGCRMYPLRGCDWSEDHE
jgi:hypothetical protein